MLVLLKVFELLELGLIDDVPLEGLEALIEPLLLDSHVLRHGQVVVERALVITLCLVNARLDQLMSRTRR